MTCEHLRASSVAVTIITLHGARWVGGGGRGDLGPGIWGDLGTWGLGDLGTWDSKFKLEA